jgi:hypothetical protein
VGLAVEMPRTERRKREKSNGISFSNVDICVLLEELQTEGDANKVILLLKTHEELESELVRQWNSNTVTNEPS